MKKPKQLSLVDAAAARDAAIDRAMSAAAEDWKSRAAAAVHHLARTRRYFSSDDLWDVLDHPREPRALGGVMRAAQINRWIAPTGRHVLSGRKACHRRPVRVWKSLIVKGS